MTKDVRAGFFSFTEITDPLEHRSYNEWHQLDHMPEQIPLEGIVSGQRWVRSPACVAAQLVASETFAPVHYMTLYLMTGPMERTLREFFDLGRQLSEVGRFHEHRRAPLSGAFEVADTLAAPRVLVSPGAVPYRPNTGVYVVVEGPPGPGRGREQAGALPRRLLEDPAVAGIWSFASGTTDNGPGWDRGDRRIILCFLDADPLDGAKRLNDAVASAHAGRLGEDALELAGPMESITPWNWDWFSGV